MPSYERQRRERVYRNDSPKRITERNERQNEYGYPKEYGDRIYEGLIPFSGDVGQVGFIKDELERVFRMSAASDVSEALGIVGNDFVGVINLLGFGVPIPFFVVEIRRDVIRVERREKQSESYQKQKRHYYERHRNRFETRLGQVCGDVFLYEYGYGTRDRDYGENVFEPKEADSGPTGEKIRETHDRNTGKIPIRENFGRRKTIMAIERPNSESSENERNEISENECEEGHGLFGFL